MHFYFSFWVPFLRGDKLYYMFEEFFSFFKAIVSVVELRLFLG